MLRIRTPASSSHPRRKDSPARWSRAFPYHAPTDTLLYYHDGQIKAEDPAVASSSAWFGARATHGVNSGSHYFECRVDSLSPQPTCRVGWSTIASHLELGKDEHGNGLISAAFAMIYVSNQTSILQDSATAARASCPLQATSLSSVNRTGPVTWSGVASRSTNQVTHHTYTLLLYCKTHLTHAFE